MAKEDKAPEVTTANAPADAAPGAVAQAFPANIPEGVSALPVLPSSDAPPAFDEYGSRLYTGPDGEDYVLAIRKDDPSGKTHHLLNKVHYANCTEQEFKRDFTRK